MTSKGRSKNLVIAIAMAMALTQLSIPAFAAEAWVNKAKKYFEADEYAKCIKVAEPHKKKNLAAMFLYLSHYQESIFTGAEDEKVKFKAYQKRLVARVSVDDIEHLLYFTDLDDKPYVVKLSRKLAKVAFKSRCGGLIPPVAG
jgi:hypothetical protein